MTIECPWCGREVTDKECWQGGVIYTCPCGAPLADEFDLEAYRILANYEQELVWAESEEDR